MNLLVEELAKARMLLTHSDPEHIKDIRQSERQLKLFENELTDPESNLRTETQDLINALTNQRKKLERIQSQNEQQHLKRKEELIFKINELVKLSDNIGTATRMLSDIQTQWKALGPVPQKDQKNIQTAYQKALDDFYYNLKIFKALQSHDLKKNETLKNELIIKLNALANSEQIRETERMLKIYRSEWDDLGPVEQHLWEDLKARYHEALQLVQNRLKNLYSEKQEEALANLNSKRQLIEKTERIIANLNEHSKLSAWNKATEEIQELQDAWKSVGFTTVNEQPDEVWKLFRAALNRFYALKKERYKQLKSLHDENRTLKNQFIEEARTLKSSKDWESATRNFIELQKKWKSVPGHGDRMEQKLYKTFRAYCDEFFESKKQHHEQLQITSQETQTELKTLVQELQLLKNPLDYNTILEFQNRWNELNQKLGLIPEKSLSQTYYSTIESLIQNCDLTAEEKTRQLYLLKLHKLSKTPQSQEALRKEKSYLQKTIQDIERQIHTYENNLGFVKSSKQENPLFANIRSQLESEKSKLEGMQLKWELFKDFTKTNQPVYK